MIPFLPIRRTAADRLLGVLRGVWFVDDSWTAGADAT
jgi:hypothetical protein